MSLHAEASPFAGQTVTLTNGHQFVIEDWWDRVSGGSWMFADGNMAAMKYALRGAVYQLPIDDEVLYGHGLTGLGDLVHLSEVAA